MRAYELIKETFCKKRYILIIHLSWLILCGIFCCFFSMSASEFGRFIFLWGGCFLALALSAGIFGDDISSGRICIIVTKPFWLGELYIYRLLGLSLQAASAVELEEIVTYVVASLVKVPAVFARRLCTRGRHAAQKQGDYHNHGREELRTLHLPTHLARPTDIDAYVIKPHPTLILHRIGRVVKSHWWL